MLLKGITWDHSRGYDPLLASSALYEKSFGLRVEWQKRSLSLFGDQSLEELSEQFDLLIIDHPHAGVAWKTGCLHALDEWVPKEKLNELVRESAGPSFSSYFYKEKLWAIPIDAALQAAAFRPDLLGNHPVPGTWDEVFELAIKLKQKNIKLGMALCPTDCLCSFLSISAMSGSPIREENDHLISKQAGLSVLEFMRRLRDSIHEESLNWNPIQLYDYMCANDDLVYSPLAFCYTNYSREGFREKKLVFTNAPGSKNAVLGGAGIGISSSTKFPEEAAKFAAWICSGQIQNTVYVEAEGQPANKMAWISPLANELTNHFFSNTLQGLENAYTRPRYPGWPAFQLKLGEIIHEFLKKDLSPSDVLEHLEAEYRLSFG